MIDQSAIAIGPYPGKNMGFDWLPVTKEHSVNNYKCVIDMHIILVRVVRSIQLNTPLKTNILLKCSLSLTILIMIRISIILLFQFNWDIIYSAIFFLDETSEFVAVVDMRSLVGAKNHCEGSVGRYWCISILVQDVWILIIE
jgi:hypothetical protein